MNDTVSKIPDGIDPIPAALVWVRLAGMILDGLPAPRNVGVYKEYGDDAVVIWLPDNDRNAVDTWAQRLDLGVPDQRPGGDLYGTKSRPAAPFPGYVVRVYTRVPVIDPPEPLVLSEADEAIAADIRTAVAE